MLHFEPSPSLFLFFSLRGGGGGEIAHQPRCSQDAYMLILICLKLTQMGGSKLCACKHILHHIKPGCIQRIYAPSNLGVIYTVLQLCKHTYHLNPC